MLDRYLLKKTMREHNDTQAGLAEALGLDASTVSRKINETRNSAFTVPELYAIQKRYKLSCKQVTAIFFGE
jgi:Transcriptional regulator containing GAF, AAA-type ATPase, and DNA binding domains